MFRRTLIALAVGFLAAALSAALQTTRDSTAGDFQWPLAAARALWSGANPYTIDRHNAAGGNWPTNPMTTVLAVLPFASLPNRIAGALIFGVGSGLLAYGLRERWQLLLFLSAPFYRAAEYMQWSPLLAACALLPALLPLTLVKPHVGLPIALTSRWRARTLVAAVLFAIPLLIYAPDWLATLDGYPGYIPVLTMPLLLLPLIRWRSNDARRFVLMACVPQQAWYDALILYTLPKSARVMGALVCLSWLGWWSMVWFSPAFATILSVYLPLALHQTVQREDTAGVKITTGRADVDLRNRAG